MIVRILGEGQYRLSDKLLAELNRSDDRVQRAIEADDQEGLTGALTDLLSTIRGGDLLADDDLSDSDLIVPDEQASLEDVRDLLAASGSSEGLIPG